jgi:hypothetical protein
VAAGTGGHKEQARLVLDHDPEAAAQTVAAAVGPAIPLHLGPSGLPREYTDFLNRDATGYRMKDRATATRKYGRAIAKDLGPEPD